MGAFALQHGVKVIPSDNTGIFVTPSTKLGSIGVQVRHRLTTHGFALNITEEPIPWFRQVIACGLPDVRAVSLSGQTGRVIDLGASIPSLISHVEAHFSTTSTQLTSEEDQEIFDMILDVENDVERAGEWLRRPTRQ